MAAKKQNERETRQARERLRVYTARVTVHERGQKRRLRDNIIAAAGLVIILVLAVSAQLLYFSGPGKATVKPSATATPTPTPTATVPAGANKGDVPSASIAQGRTWTGTMTINNIPLSIELDGKAAPQAVSSTVSLVQKGFYDGVSCHRLTDGGFYVLQCGDPAGDGTGGPGYSYGPIENAPADNVYDTGVLAMARQGNNAYSQGSQFFIVYKTTTITADDAGGYTVIGTITGGLDALNAAVTSQGITAGSGAHDGKPKVATTIDSITVE